MATESYEAAIKGLNDLLRYDQTFSLLCFKGQTETIITYRVCRPYSPINAFFLLLTFITWIDRRLIIFWIIILSSANSLDVESRKKVIWFSVRVFNSHDPDPRHLGFVVRVRLILAVHHAFTLFSPFYFYFYAFFFCFHTWAVRKQIWETSPRRRSKCWLRSSRSSIPPTATPLNGSNPVSPTSKPRNTCESLFKK